MKNTEFQKCLRLLNYSDHGDEAVILHLIDPTVDILENYIDPYRIEININILNYESTQGKKDLLKYYMFELKQPTCMFKDNDSILNHYYNYSPTKYISIVNDKEVILNEFENYVVNSSIIFDMLLNEIQLICWKYKIDFFNLCEELEFDLSVFDSSLGDLSTSNNKAVCGFNSDLNNDQIERLYIQALNKFIDKDTDEEHFNAIFKNKPLPADFIQIKWIGAKNLLSYLVDILFSKSENNLWKKASNCFDVAENLKQSKNLYLINRSGKPKNSDTIDAIIKNIYTPLQ